MKIIYTSRNLFSEPFAWAQSFFNPNQDVCHPTVSGRHLGRLKSAFCFPVQFQDVCSGKDKDMGILSAFSQRDMRGEGRQFRALMISPCSWEPRVSFIFVCSESGTLNLQHALTVSNLYTLLRFVVREGT